MKFAQIEGVSVAGISACVPKRVVDNVQFGAELFGGEIENVVNTTGVKQRHICPDEGGVTALDMSVRAAQNLFQESSFSPRDIGGIVFVTQTPDHIMPNNATHCQHLLGISKNCAAFDMNLACSGYVYGLWTAAMMVKSLGAPVILLDGENHSYFTSPLDRATALLFGDAGSATLLVPNENSPAWRFGFLTDAENREALIIPSGGSRNLLNEDSLKMRKMPDGGTRRDVDIYMNGMEVFNFVVRNVPVCLEELMNETKKRPEEIDLLLLHQANLFMVRQVAKKIGFPSEKVPVSIDRYGNSSSCTIPITICSELKEQVSAQKNLVLASGFGAGLSVACGLFELGDCVCCGVSEL